MEFKEKLLNLRKQKGLTQEELAQKLYVSRTAVSKWESGRGLPNIESLKGIASLFGVTVDELLSGDEILEIAERDTSLKEKNLRDYVFGILDISTFILFFLPFFADRAGEIITEVSLFYLTQTEAYLYILYFVLVLFLCSFGIVSLALKNKELPFFDKYKSRISLILTFVTSLIFIISLQPYAAGFLFVFLMIKVLILIKNR